MEKMEKIDLIIIAVLIVVIVIVIYFFESKIRKSIDDKFSFYEELNNGYTTLIKLLYHDEDKNDLDKIIKKIISKRADGRYVNMDSNGKYVFNTHSFLLDSFYELMKNMQRKEINFILELDDKVTLQTLNDFLQNCLGNKISDNSFMQTYLDKDKSDFSYGKTLLAYQKTLNKEFIQLGLLHDGFGSYYLLVFHINQEKAIKKSVNAIGLKYEQLLLANNFNLKDDNEANPLTPINSNADFKFSSKKAKGL